MQKITQKEFAVGQVLARTAKGAGLSGDSSPPTPLSVKSSLILGETETNCKRKIYLHFDPKYHPLWGEIT
jgi:hypothetical protein